MYFLRKSSLLVLFVNLNSLIFTSSEPAKRQSYKRDVLLKPAINQLTANMQTLQQSIALARTEMDSLKQDLALALEENKAIVARTVVTPCSATEVAARK